METSVETQSYSKRHWITFGLIALLWHILLFLFHPEWKPSPIHLPPRVEVQPIDPTELDQIRKQWRSREKSLLLGQDNRPNEAKAPDQARYSSDKNRTVEKEQRARLSDVMPRPGVPGQATPAKAGAQSRPQAQPAARPEPRLKALPQGLVRQAPLSAFGVPFNLKQARLTPEPPPQPQSDSQMGDGQNSGADQSLIDRNLPQGDRNLLNTQESIYYSFYSRLYSAIAPIWQSQIRQVPTQRRIAPGEYTTVVNLILDQDGNLVDIVHIHNSGISEFDSAVDTAWKKIGKFPNPPKGLLDARGQVSTAWTFNVSIGENEAWQFGRPERAN